MVEPSRSVPIKRLLNFVRMGLPFISRREQLAWLENTLQEMLAGRARVVPLPAEAGIDQTQRLQELQSGALRRGRQVGCGRSCEALLLPYSPVVELLPALLDQPSRKIESTLSTNRQDRVELHAWAALSHRRDQEGGYCHVHDRIVAACRPIRDNGRLSGASKRCVTADTAS
jgi:hypothetical protein